MVANTKWFDVTLACYQCGHNGTKPVQVEIGKDYFFGCKHCKNTLRWSARSLTVGRMTSTYLTVGLYPK